MLVDIQRGLRRAEGFLHRPVLIFGELGQDFGAWEEKFSILSAIFSQADKENSATNILSISTYSVKLMHFYRKIRMVLHATLYDEHGVALGSEADSQ